MKTPHAILIGLALIAAALFFREPSVPPAQAGLVDGASGLQCRQWQSLSGTECFIVHGPKITRIIWANRWDEPVTANFR